MTQSRLTVNCLPQYAADFGTLLRFLHSLDPVSVVVGIDSMNAANLVNQIAAALPKADVIGRFIFPSDGGMHLKPQAAGDTRQWIVSPGDALNAWGSLGTNTDGTHRRKLYLVNEPQATDADQDTIGRLVQWTIETIGLATTRGISLCVLNFGVGHPMLLPNGDYDARFDDVLTILSKQRDLHTLGIHVYAPADSFSRLDGIVSRCKALGIKPPRIQITEFGFDAADGGDKLNGYRSRGYSGQQFAAWEIDKIKNVYQPYFSDDTLQSVATFCWGNDASWKNFNVEQDVDWQAAILDAAQKGLLSVTMTPPTVIPPPKPAYAPSAFVAGEKYTLQSKGGERTNVHSSPLVAVDNKLALIEDKTVVTILDVTQHGFDWWYHVSIETPPVKDGYISGRGGDLTFTPVPIPVVIPTPIIPDTPPPAPAQPSVWARLYDAQLKVSQAHYDLAQLYKQIDEETKLGKAA